MSRFGAARSTAARTTRNFPRQERKRRIPIHASRSGRNVQTKRSTSPARIPRVKLSFERSPIRWAHQRGTNALATTTSTITTPAATSSGQSGLGLGGSSVDVTSTAAVDRDRELERSLLGARRLRLESLDELDRSW